MVTRQDHAEDTNYRQLQRRRTQLLVSGCSMEIKTRSSSCYTSHATVDHQTAESGANPLCGAKSVMRQVYMPPSSVLLGHVSPDGGGGGAAPISRGQSSASKHVSVERFRVRSVAGVRGKISGRSRRASRWARVGTGATKASMMEREVLKIPFVTFPRFEESCLRRTYPRLCQQYSVSSTNSINSNLLQSLPAASDRFSSSSVASSGQSVPSSSSLKGELIPERYHPLRDATTYAELRAILDRNGKYLRRANTALVGQGRCNYHRWQNKTLARDCDGPPHGGTDLQARTTTQQQVRQRVRARLGQLSHGPADNAPVSCVRKCVQDSSATSDEEERLEAFRKFANYYYSEGFQWHLDYLKACSQRAEEVKQRFVEKKFCNSHRQKSSDAGSSVFKVPEANSEVLEDQSDRIFSRKRVFRSSIMDNYPSKLCQEKSEKIHNLIDDLYQLKLDAAELENEALPKIVLTDCSSNPSRNSQNPSGNEAKSVQNNNGKSISRDDSLKRSVSKNSDNHLNNNGGCFLQPHFNDLHLDNCLSIPTTKYQSEARPP